MKEKFEKEQKDNHNHIEDLMTDMPDMEDDEKFRQWLEETYINEAELMEQSLLAGREYEKNRDIAEELSVPREKFYQRLKEEGLYEEEAEASDENSDVSKITENDGSILSTDGDKIVSMETKGVKEAGAAAKADADKIIAMEKSMPVRKKRSYLRLGKVAGVAGVCLLCVFAASMTSEANRNHFIDGIRYLAGDDVRVVVDNNKDNEISNTDEYKAIEDIEKKIDVKVPEFYYRPVGMEFYKYIIDEPATLAKIQYEYKNTIITFYIDRQSEDVASDIYVMHGEEQESVVAGDEETEVVIKKINDKNEKLSNYMASWSKDDVIYILSGRIDIEELKKIIKYMKF